MGAPNYPRLFQASRSPALSATEPSRTFGSATSTTSASTAWLTISSAPTVWCSTPSAARGSRATTTSTSTAETGSNFVRIFLRTFCSRCQVNQLLFTWSLITLGAFMGNLSRTLSPLSINTIKIEFQCPRVIYFFIFSLLLAFLQLVLQMIGARQSRGLKYRLLTVAFPT